MNLLRCVIAVWMLGGIAGTATLAEDGALPSLPRLTVKRRVEVVGSEPTALAREPMIAELADGTLFVAGYGGKDPNAAPKLWKSADGGTSWSRVDVGKPADGAIGNSDVDLAVAPDGTLYFASMGFDRTTNFGTHIAIGVSKDKGATWRWTVLTREKGVDRPWVEVAPDGTAYVIWNDGKSVFCAKSGDGGKNWTTGTVTTEGGGSSHLAIGPKGEIAVRVTPVSESGHGFTEGADYVAISTDGAKTWVRRALIGERDWVAMEKMQPKDTPRWVEPLAWDANGNLYSVWAEKKTIRLARSSDQGKTWKELNSAACDGMCFFPYLAAKGDEVAFTYMAGDEKKMAFYVQRHKMRETSRPEVWASTAEDLDVWTKSEKEGAPPEASGGGEYDAVVFLRDGNLGVATPVQDEAKKRFGFVFYEMEKRER